MAAFHRASLASFLNADPDRVIAQLATAYAQSGFTSLYADQTLTWRRDLSSLREALRTCADRDPVALQWFVLLEYEVPRKEVRIDVVLLAGAGIVLLELKTSRPTLAARRQVEQYALLLHYFHKASAERRIVPLLVSPEAAPPPLAALRQQELFPQLAAYWIAPVLVSTWEHLPNLLLEAGSSVGLPLPAEQWEQSPYFPVPTILEAAVGLRSGLSLGAIAHCEASEHEIAQVRETIQQAMLAAQRDRQHVICFLTGVPGSGKTLVGLSLAFSPENTQQPIHFMSGNGPLVAVIQQLFTQEARRRGASVAQGRTEARTLVENVHRFATNYADRDPRAPSNHALIFDEAQRAWDREQNFRKFKRDYSEPEMLLRIMGRHEDWAFVLALVGGGQEINSGESGLGEWGRALTTAAKPWQVLASPQVLEGGPSTAGQRLFVGQDHMSVTTLHKLHLQTSNRSLRAEQLASWVNLLLEGQAEAAAALRITERFPVFLTRSLAQTRALLRQQRRGESRIGLAGSSGAARLRAEGLEPDASFHASYRWDHWYLAPESDTRSSHACEVLATEFEIQGLELDWVGVCWGGDMIWHADQGWVRRKLHQGSTTRWREMQKPERRRYRTNAYRVLLTRARQGMVLFVPAGDAGDPTRSPDEFDRTAEFLLRAGVLPAPEVSSMEQGAYTD